MLILFSANPLAIREVDSSFAMEALSAEKQGFESALIDSIALQDEQNIGKAVRHVPMYQQETQACYRGWMLAPALYTQLYNALLHKHNIKLINTPESYQLCHYFPDSYLNIAAHTAPSVWITPEEMSKVLPNLKRSKDAGTDDSQQTEWESFIKHIMEKLVAFHHAPVILKDYVKSRKHEWLDACYIPNSGNQSDVERVVRTFLQRQGGQLEGGLVFREYLALTSIGTHPKSGMPLTEEYRLFFVNTRLLACYPYWESAEYPQALPSLKEFQQLATKVQSNFFTMDIARKADGTWIIIELGDGQVSGLPPICDTTQFYAQLFTLV